MKQEIKIIASDFDGTLTSGMEISQNAKDVILQTLSRGIKIGLASGRRLSSMRDIVVANGLKWGDPYPSFLVCQERFIFTADNRDFRGAEDWNLQQKKETNQWVSFVLSHLSEWLKNLKLLKYEPEHWTMESDNNLTFQYQNPNIAKKVARLMRSWLEGKQDSSVKIRQRRVWVELTPLMGKGATLFHLAHILNLAPRSILAVGDSSNDLDMLDGHFGFSSAAVANAEPAIKEAVLKNKGYIASTCCGDGLAETIEKFCGKIKTEI